MSIRCANKMFMIPTKTGIKFGLYLSLFVSVSMEAAVLESANRDLLENETKDLVLRSHCEEPTGSFFGLEFSLSGYNILHGYPKESGRDPGWRAPIFEAVFEPPRYTSDCSYRLPAGIDIQRTVACSTSFTSKETKTQLDFAHELETSASVSGTAWGASFSASMSYREAVQEMRDRAAVYVLSEAKCMYYSAIMNPGIPPPLSRGFLTYLRELERDGTREKYFDFFNNYGTHFAKTVEYGARYTRTHKMSSESYKRISESGYSVEATASYDGLFSVSGSASLSEEQTEAVESFHKEVITTTSTLGALPNAAGDHNTWAAEVKDTPAPIVYSLESMEELFTARYFNGVTDCDYYTIRSNIIRYKAETEYCQYLINRGEISSCEAPTEQLCEIPVVEHGSVICRKPSGIETTVARDGDICSLTCNEGLFLTIAVNPVVTCEAFGRTASFDQTPSCQTYHIMHLRSPHGNYAMNAWEAENMCASKGARMATVEELSIAFQQGWYQIYATDRRTQPRGEIHI